jgi:hypothetical protein
MSSGLRSIWHAQACPNNRVTSRATAGWSSRSCQRRSDGPSPARGAGCASSSSHPPYRGTRPVGARFGPRRRWTVCAARFPRPMRHRFRTPGASSAGMEARRGRLPHRVSGHAPTSCKGTRVHRLLSRPLARIGHDGSCEPINPTNRARRRWCCAGIVVRRSSHAFSGFGSAELWRPLLLAQSATHIRRARHRARDRRTRLRSKAAWGSGS